MQQYDVHRKLEARRPECALQRSAASVRWEVRDGHQPSLTKGRFQVPQLATLTLAATWNWPPEGRHPKVPVRQWVPSLPIPLRVLLATQPEMVTPVLQVVQRVVARSLLEAAGLKADEYNGGAVALTQLRLGC